MSWMRRLVCPIALLAAAAACAAPGAPAVVTDPCLLLLQAEPHQWTERLPAVQALGAAGAPHLVELLRQQPAAPGAEAAVASLGRTGGDGVVAFLAGEVDDRSHLATEAALALGELRAAAARPVLAACLQDHLADPTLRTAAACALVRAGDAATATPLLRAVLLAGSPAGASPEREQGLPARSRWALERYLVQRLLRQEGADELAQALDPDASWPALEAAAARVLQWLASR